MESRRLRILLVDDDEDDYVLTRDLLSEIEGGRFDLEWVATYDAALEAIGSNRHDVYLLDYRLGDRNGLELLREAVVNGCQAPMILLTGQGDHEVDVEAIKTGAADYLIKGQIDGPLLQRSIHYAIERKRAEAALRESEKQYRDLYEEAPIAYFSVDIDGRITRVNPYTAQMSGYTRDDLVGRPVFDLYADTPSGKEKARNVVFRRFLAGKETRGEELEWRTADGRSVWINLTVRPGRDAEGRVVESRAMAVDITQRKQAEEQIRREKEFSEMLINSSVDGILAFDRDCRITVWNPGMERISGVSQEGCLGKCAFDVFPFLKDIGEDRYLYAALEGRTVVAQDRPYTVPETGREGFFEGHYSPLRGESGEIVGGLAIIRDITERKRAEEQLLHGAFHDALTGLPNRALFMDRLGRSIERAKRREDHLFAVLFLDLDRFKVVNDSLGHTIGDQLLIAMAPRLEGCVRATDTVARLGGDEFVILLEDIEAVSDATRVAGRIREVLTVPFNLDGHEMFTTASIGIVLSATSYEQPEDILRDADIAMYRAKALGKARYELFDAAMRDHVVARLRLETDLRRAIERQEFEIHYQPIVSLADGRIAGFEALLRWQHPEHGLVSPGEFIPVAEETGLIVPIDQWVLRETCGQMRAWQAQFPADPPLTISVNLSSKQFAQPDLIEQIEQVLRETGLDARSLKLEITESVIMENGESAAVMLSRLRALGVQVHMDDFGTGYSSLSYLHQFPIDTIKIDRSFIGKMGVDGNNSEIAQAIVMLARDLGMDVIAEGVETAEQLVRLRALECEYGQGYHFSKPLDSEAAGALIAEALAVGGRWARLWR
ncbi:MAG: EAL domain-containing protein [Anaerolineae bacterium]